MTPSRSVWSSLLCRTPDIVPADLEYEVRRRAPSGVPRGLAELIEPMRRARGQDGA